VSLRTLEPPTLTSSDLNAKGPVRLEERMV
jgi:hypothetical protein